MLISTLLESLSYSARICIRLLQCCLSNSSHYREYSLIMKTRYFFIVLIIVNCFFFYLLNVSQYALHPLQRYYQQQPCSPPSSISPSSSSITFTTITVPQVKPLHGNKLKMLFLTHGYNYEGGMDRFAFIHYHGMKYVST